MRKGEPPTDENRRQLEFMRNDAIGVFDSGMGGLTAVKELNAILPQENIIYFGDTARIPYGSRSPETIMRYAREDVAFLRQHAVKMIIAACGTVSSVVGDRPFVTDLPFTGVVLPAAETACRITKNGRIGFIGTPATVRSGSYEKAIHKLRPEVQLISSGAEAAKYARRCLEARDLLSDRKEPGENTYYVSDSTEMFIENAGHFLHQDVVGKVFRCSL